MVHGNLLIGRKSDTCESCTFIEVIQRKVGKRNGANYVEPPDELEKKLRFKTIERFGGITGDLSKAVEESILTWVAKDKEHTDKAMNYDWPFNINSTLRVAFTTINSNFLGRKDYRRKALFRLPSAFTTRLN